MTRKNRARSSSLFLMELILAILFFSVASAVCVQFFVKSHLLSKQSHDMNYAVNECSNVAEILNAAHGTAESEMLLKEMYPEGYSDMAIYYDKDFIPCDLNSASYVLTLQMQETDDMLEADIQMERFDSESSRSSADENVIYKLSTKHHIARRTGYEAR